MMTASGEEDTNGWGEMESRIRKRSRRKQCRVGRVTDTSSQQEKETWGVSSKYAKEDRIWRKQHRERESEKRDAIWHYLTLWMQSHPNHSEKPSAPLWSWALWAFRQPCTFTPTTTNESKGRLERNSTNTLLTLFNPFPVWIFVASNLWRRK